NSSSQKVVMSIEEYETIRLMDYQGFTQEQASERMKIARTTVQSIYEQARKNISQALVEGKDLVIAGGTYELCKGEEDECNCGGCEKHRNFLEGDKKL
ncbi:MAG: DUF134 domain-containing protein, partial [Clostridia bacterium]